MLLTALHKEATQQQSCDLLIKVQFLNLTFFIVAPGELEFEK